MKCLVYAAAAVLALASQISPAFASQTAAPTIKLIPLSPANVAIVSGGAHCNKDAAIDGTPYFEMPQIALEMAISGTSQVKIDLAATGDLKAASLFASSGNAVLDNAALRTAKLNRYIPETVNCRHVAGSYLVQVEF
jgi:TonB family protein